MSNKDTEAELEALRKENETSGSRLDADNPTKKPELVDHLVDALDDIQHGPGTENISAYDPVLAALLEGIERDGSLEDVFSQLEAEYSRDAGLSSVSKGAIVRLAVRVGLEQIETDLIKSVAEAKKERSGRTI